MKGSRSSTRDPSPAEQEAAFAAEYEQRNASLNGRHTEKAPRKRYARRPGPPRYFRGILPGSGRGRLLEVARGLGSTFYEWELMREAWHRWPDTFGVAGVSSAYPSDKKVSSAISGKRGLVARGLFQRLPDGRLRVASPPG